MATPQPPSPPPSPTELFSLDLLQDGTLLVHINVFITCMAIVTAAAFIVIKLIPSLNMESYEIDEAEIGIGNSKFKLKPNTLDRQVAYSIWVELSTRKIGLPIDFDHDLIVEVYDSWYAFFGITRELIKTIPVVKVRNDSTQAIIQMSIRLLNDGLRPHLTHWQARFRNWYDAELKNTAAGSVVDPQDIQKQFPLWNELAGDMERVNKYLMQYRNEMSRLVKNARR